MNNAVLKKYSTFRARISLLVRCMHLRRCIAPQACISALDWSFRKLAGHVSLGTLVLLVNGPPREFLDPVDSSLDVFPLPAGTIPGVTLEALSSCPMAT